MNSRLLLQASALFGAGALLTCGHTLAGGFAPIRPSPVPNPNTVVRGLRPATADSPPGTLQSGILSVPPETLVQPTAAATANGINGFRVPLNSWGFGGFGGFGAPYGYIAPEFNAPPTGYTTPPPPPGNATVIPSWSGHIGNNESAWPAYSDRFGNRFAGYRGYGAYGRSGPYAGFGGNGAFGGFADGGEDGGDWNGGAAWSRPAPWYCPGLLINPLPVALANPAPGGGIAGSVFAFDNRVRERHLDPEDRFFRGTDGRLYYRTNGLYLPGGGIFMRGGEAAIPNPPNMDVPSPESAAQ